MPCQMRPERPPAWTQRPLLSGADATVTPAARLRALSGFPGWEFESPWAHNRYFVGGSELRARRAVTESLRRCTKRCPPPSSYENRWAAPFATAVRRDGGQVMNAERISPASWSSPQRLVAVGTRGPLATASEVTRVQGHPLEGQRPSPRPATCPALGKPNTRRRQAGAQ